MPAGAANAGPPQGHDRVNIPARGLRNLITDVAGLSVGNAEDRPGMTGTTVLLCDRPMTAAVEIRGGAPGTRETAALDAVNTVEHIHAIVLSGGSVFGLDAASAVTFALAGRGIGFRFGTQPWPCPLVPAAVLFDISNGGDKTWPAEPPYRRLGLEALEAAGADFRLGNAGAGLGAVAGELKGGLGSASIRWNDYTLGALVAVNSVGSPVMPGSARLWAMDSAIGDEMGPLQPPRGADHAPLPPLAHTKLALRDVAAATRNTTIAIIACDAHLSVAETSRLAIMAVDGMARAIRPIHTPFDGDTVFALATGAHALPEPRMPALAALGTLAADCLARAIGRAIWAADSLGRWPSYRAAHRL
ncbi:MAG: P1 family peptidase [Rhizobiales bacterium]|nr:P1 family peptidase [Hyphomicrobiales bacterium]